MKKILITGGAGFIGSHLADFFLKKHYAVTVIDNLSWGKKEFLQPFFGNPRFTFIHSDLLDYESLLINLSPDTDTVFHLAANSDISRSSNNPEIDVKFTIMATFNLLQAMKNNGVRRIFYTSGSGVYGDVGDLRTAETYAPLFPASMYGATKLSAEAMISAYVHLFNMQAWIVRPANIIGPRATHGVVHDFIQKLRIDPTQLTILGDGKQSKSYLYITDVINAIYLIWTKEKSDISIYNLANDDFISVNEIATSIVKAMKLKKVKIERTGGKIGWKGDVPIVRLNSSRIKQLGWVYDHTSKSAVIHTINALLEE